MSDGPAIDKPATISLTVYLELLEALRSALIVLSDAAAGGRLVTPKAMRQQIVQQASAAIARAEAEL